MNYSQRGLEEQRADSHRLLSKTKTSTKANDRAAGPVFPISDVRAVLGCGTQPKIKRDFHSAPGSPDLTSSDFPQISNLTNRGEATARRSGVLCCILSSRAEALQGVLRLEPGALYS